MIAANLHGYETHTYVEDMPQNYDELPDEIHLHMHIAATCSKTHTT